MGRITPDYSRKVGPGGPGPTFGAQTTEAYLMPRYAIRSLSVLGLAAVLATVVGAQAPSLTPAQVDRVTSQVVVKLLEQNHMAHPSIDDATAVKWARTFLKDLDPLKYNFVKADVDEFMAQAETLDDKVKQGDTSFAKVVFDRFLKLLGRAAGQGAGDPRQAGRLQEPTSRSATTSRSSNGPPTPPRPTTCSASGSSSSS